MKTNVSSKRIDLKTVLIILASLFVKFVVFPILGFIALFILVLLIPTEPSPVVAIDLQATEISLDEGTVVNQYFTVTATGEFSDSDLRFISEDESIATVEFKEFSMTNYVYFTVTGISAGTTEIYFQNSDGTVTSERITVSVKGKESVALPESTENRTDKTSASTSSTNSKHEHSTDTSDTNEETSSTSSQTSSSTSSSQSGTSNSGTPSGSGSSSTSKPETPKELVWVSGSGKKYHNNPECSGMKNPRQITKEEAEAGGRSACKNCYS